MSTGTLLLPAVLREAILAAAARAYPDECCGLIEGVREGHGWRTVLVHETTNCAREPRIRFLVDAEAQFALLRRLRGSGRDIIGCFHSHPGGAPAPSPRDRDAAAEVDFLWLVAGGGPSVFALGAFVFDAQSGFVPVAISAC